MPGQRTRQRVLAVTIGGIAGASLRWAVLTSIPPGRFPWPVLAINIAGSVVLGMLLTQEPAHSSVRTLLHDGGGIGFCGGLTTFSTFALEVVNLARSSNTSLAAIYVIASVIGAVAGVIVGAAAFGRVRALTRPLEEEP